MPSVEIVTIGTELLLGQLIDTNSVHVAGALAGVGVDVYAKHSVGDNAARLEALLHDVLTRADGAVTTGGLGPTVDDLTKDAVASVAGVALQQHEASVRAIEERLTAFGRRGPLSPNNRRQAFLPAGSVVFPNPNGTAPGFVAFRADGKFIACMPGVPREMTTMLSDQLVPWLVERYALREAIYTRTLHTIGISESDVDSRIEPLFATLENPKIAVLAHDFRVDVKIMAKAGDASRARSLIEPVECELRDRIGEAVFGADEQTLASIILAELVRRGRTVATAESITGGALADEFVGVPGASRAFVGGVIAYDNAVKRELLGTPADMLREHGAVSEPVAIAMARGACVRLGADVAVATTGIAGPTGATPDKPVGLAYVAVAIRGGAERARRLSLTGSRADIRRRATLAALDFLRRQG